MIRRDGERVLIEGPVTFETASSVLDAASREARDGARIVDFSAVTESDSAALALALELLRQAETDQRTIALDHVPEPLRKLAELYSLSAVIFPSA
jgi:phospholipid transport system transporter-binding protein